MFLCLVPRVTQHLRFVTPVDIRKSLFPVIVHSFDYAIGVNTCLNNAHTWRREHETVQVDDRMGVSTIGSNTIVLLRSKCQLQSIGSSFLIR